MRRLAQQELCVALGLLPQQHRPRKRTQASPSSKPTAASCRCAAAASAPTNLAIALRKGLQHAIITENNGVHGVEIINEIGDKAIIANNEPVSPPKSTK